jgi:uncharacterized protein
MFDFLANIDWAAIAPYIAIGFTAQMIDGALGMAFGVISSTLLVSVMGIPPARASAGVHLVEMFTTGASGISHVLHKNVDWKLFARIAVPGVIGGCLGAYILSNIDASVTRPLVMLYLTCIGFYLLYKALTYPSEPKIKEAKVAMPLGLIGGFLDASGGGGWGPVVTSNLLIQGTDFHPDHRAGGVYRGHRRIIGRRFNRGTLWRDDCQACAVKNIIVDGRHSADRHQLVQPV